MPEKNYDILKKVNNFYFNSNPNLNLIIPRSYDDDSEEGKAIISISNLVDQKNYDHAIALAEKCLQHFPQETHNAFLVWQIAAFWKKEIIPNEEFRAYFDSMEEMYPNYAYLNFDKAILFIGEQRFNDAVEELKKARQKEPHHAPTLSLLFLIYYLAKDEQWKSLLLTVSKSKLLPERVINLIQIGEAIINKKPSPLYMSADKENLTKKNNEILEKFPKFILNEAPKSQKILMAVADSNYLKEYISTLILSGIEFKERDFGLHIHVYDPSDEDINFLRKYALKYPELSLSFSSESGNSLINSKTPTYYAAMRFSRAWQILKKDENIKIISIVDADALIRKTPFVLPEVQNCNAAFTFSSELAPFWDRFAGGFASFKGSEEGQDILSYITNIILKNIMTGKEFWFIDQVALFDTYKNSIKNNGIGQISSDILFGMNMQHTEDAVFWTYTNDHKTEDNPMNRERKRLLENIVLIQRNKSLINGHYI